LCKSNDQSFQFWGFKDESIFFGLNCVDNSFFKRDKHRNSGQDVHIKLPERYFLSVGRQIPKKNLILLLKAYRQYLKITNDSPISLVIVGDGPQNFILRLIAGELIDQHIFFLPFLTQEQLTPIYSRASTYVLPSLHGETWGLTVNEAMASGKPVVVSNQCGCSETLVHPGNNGWIFDPTNRDELTNIFLEIGAMSQTLIEDMGRRSEEIVAGWGLENFTKGIWDALIYAFNKNRKNYKTGLWVPRVISHFWTGRYRPEMPVRKIARVKISHLVILHTDLRLYWRSRLLDLQRTFKKIGIRLDIVEIAGEGSPYAFENKAIKNDNLNWHILFPGKAAEDIPSPLSQNAICNKLKELNPDVVMAGAIAYQSGTGALKWKAETGKPVIIFDDARPEDVQRSWFINTIKKIFYREVDAVICPAPSHLKGFIRWGLPEEEIFYGIDVVDNEFFGKKNNGNPEESKKDKIPKPYLLAVGRQIEKKNWLKLIEAFVLYKKENSDSRLNLVFIGDGPLHDSLVEAAESNRRKDIIFIPFVQQKVIVQYYQAAKGIILPSRYGETWGLVVNEAMAAGLPVLVSRECGCSEMLVREGINGWTFDPNNTEEISDKINKLDCLTQEQWEKMSLASTEIISEWGLDRFTQGVLDALVYISTKPKIKTGWLGNILVHFWNGRYRPV